MSRPRAYLYHKEVIMFSSLVKSTPLKMNWWQYWIEHCWMTGWKSIHGAFSIWGDLMSSNYEIYALPRTVEDPEQECLRWFWVSLGEDNTYPKEVLEHIIQMVDGSDTRK